MIIFTLLALAVVVFCLRALRSDAAWNRNVGLVRTGFWGLNLGLGLMMLLAGTSIFIKVIFPGHFSYIHLLTAWVLLITPLAVMAVRRGKVGMHARFMTGLFYMGLITAGAFTFMPGRILYKVFFGG